MRIGIDIDGTINDLHSAILNYGMENNEKISGNGIKDENAYRIRDIFDWKEEECVRFKSYFQHKILNIIEPRAGARKNISKLQEQGHKIYIITCRKPSEMDNTQKETKEWLIKNCIPFDELIIEENDKGVACANNKIDIFIDDSPKHLEKIINNSNAKVYIYDNVYNRKAENNKYDRIYSFEDLYEEITNLK